MSYPLNAFQFSIRTKMNTKITQHCYIRSVQLIHNTDNIITSASLSMVLII